MKVKLSTELYVQMCALAHKRHLDETVILPETVILAVTDQLGISMELIASRARAREVAEARFILVYLLRKYVGLKLREIAAYVGNRDHATVYYSIDTAKDLLTSYKPFASKLNAVEVKLINQ